MARFFQVRRSRREQSTANTVTTCKDHDTMGVGNQPRLGVVKLIRKRVEKRWPSSTKTRLSVQMPTGSNTTEDTDEVSENKLPQSGELIAEVGTDGGNCDQKLSSGKGRKFTVADRQRLSTVQESQSKKSRPKIPLPTKNAMRKERSHAEEATTANIHNTIPDVVVSPKKRNSIVRQQQRCVSATESPTQTPVSLVNTLENKLRSLDWLRKMISRAQLQQESDTPQPVSPQYTTPIQPLSFWCQPVFSCSQHTAEHLLPFGTDDDDEDDDDDDDDDDDHTIDVSSHSGSTIHQGISFLDNVINHLVGQDSQGDSTVADTAIESLLDDDTSTSSVFVSTRYQRNGSGQPARSTKDKPAILDTLAKWDELDREVSEYEPDDRAGENVLSFEFSKEESWVETDDDYTESTDYTGGASAYTFD